MKKIAKYLLVFLFLIIVDFITGNHFFRFLQATSIRVNFQEWSAKITGITLPENIEIVHIQTLISPSGGGGDTVYLQLTIEQVNVLLKQIKNRSDWEFVSEKRVFPPCQMVSEIKPELLDIQEYYKRSVNSEGVEEIAIFCPSLNRLKLQTKYD